MVLFLSWRTVVLSGNTRLLNEVLIYQSMKWAFRWIKLWAAWNDAAGWQMDASSAGGLKEDEEEMHGCGERPLCAEKTGGLNQRKRKGETGKNVVLLNLKRNSRLCFHQIHKKKKDQHWLLVERLVILSTLPGGITGGNQRPGQTWALPPYSSWTWRHVHWQLLQQNQFICSSVLVLRSQCPTCFRCVPAQTYQL